MDTAVAADDDVTEGDDLQEPVQLPKDGTQILRDVLKHRGWDEREGQVMMVQSINDALSVETTNRTDVAVNAPVGTGKTLGYLLAALAQGKRIIVTTSTKGLQDQIINDELPKLRDDLKEIYGYHLTYSLLKGQSNYPCLSAAQALLDGEGVDEEENTLLEDVVEASVPPEDTEHLQQIIERAHHAMDHKDSANYDAEHLMKRVSLDIRGKLRATRACGVKSESYLPPEMRKEDATSLNPGDCEEALNMAAHMQGCVQRYAYANALKSQIVVINTSLLVYEIMKAEKAYLPTTPKLLNGVDTVVIDEAHHLPRILADAYSLQVDFEEMSNTAGSLVKKLRNRYSQEPHLIKSISKLDKEIEKLAESLEDHIFESGQSERPMREELASMLSQFGSRTYATLNSLRDSLSTHESISPSGLKVNKNGLPKATAAQINELIEVVYAQCTALASAVSTTNQDKDFVNNLTYNENNPDSTMLTIDSVPVDVSFFRDQLFAVTTEHNLYLPYSRQRSNVILSSGTISVQTPTLVGMSNDNYLDVESPFNPQNVRFYAPATISKPNAPNWADQAWSEMRQAIQRLGGRTMILTTSNKMLREFTERCRAELQVTTFSQSDFLSKNELVEKFKNTDNSVLVGTTSFWEGVDIPGPDLSLVIIDKIMFPMINDPIFMARRTWVEKHGGNKFMEVDVDFASIMMAQGTGRLIRSVTDVGGIMVMDPRLVDARYAGAVMKLMPAKWPLTSDLDEFLQWLDWVKNPTDTQPSPDSSKYRSIRPSRPKRSMGRRNK